MKTNTLVAMVVMTLMGIGVGYFMNGNRSQMVPHQFGASSNEFYETQYMVNIDSHGIKVDQYDATDGSGTKRVRFVLECTVTSLNEDVWIPSQADSASKPDTGFLICVYNENGPITSVAESSMQVLIDTDAEQTPRGLLIPANQTKRLSISMEMPSFEGSRGVRLESVRLLFHPDFPGGMELPIQGDQAYDSGLINLKDLDGSRENGVPVSPADKGGVAI